MTSLEPIAENLKKIQDYVKSLETKVAELEKEKAEKAETEQKMKGKVPQDVINYIKNHPESNKTFDYLCQYGIELGFETIALIRDKGNSDAIEEILNLVKNNKDLVCYLVKQGDSFKFFRTYPFKPQEVIDLIFEKQITIIEHPNDYCDYTSEEVLEYIVKCLQEGKQNSGFLCSISNISRCPPRYQFEFAKYGVVNNSSTLRNTDFIKYLIESKTKIEDVQKIWQPTTLTDQEYLKDKHTFDLLFYHYPDLVDFYSAIPLQVAFNLNSNDIDLPNNDIKHKKVLEGNRLEFRKELVKKLSDKDKIQFCAYVGLPLEHAGFDTEIWARFAKERNEFMEKIGKK